MALCEQLVGAPGAGGRVVLLCSPRQITTGMSARAALFTGTPSGTDDKN
jgi:hypothetical protein